eukprot:9436412-Pyramimonas_sp.AAC.2
MAGAGTVLVTGGAGYIGTHTSLCLLSQGFHVVVVDNLSNSSEEAIVRTKALAGDKGKNLVFYKVRLPVVSVTYAPARAFWLHTVSRVHTPRGDGKRSPAAGAWDNSFA